MTRSRHIGMAGLLGVACLLALPLPAALGQTITSPDRLWWVIFDRTLPGYGQISIFDAPMSRNNIFQTIWYDATPANIGGTSDRVEFNYTPVSEVVGPNSASFTLDRNGGGLQFVVDVTVQ